MNMAAEYYKAGTMDSEARDKLLKEQLSEVRFIARRIHDRLPQHVSLDDLVHAGVLGLLDAVNKYCPDRNVQFTTYARFRIKGAIIDSLRALDWSPRELRHKARGLEQAEKALRNSLGRAPTEVEIAAEMGVSLDEFQGLLTDLRGLDIASLDGDGSDGDAGRTDLASQIKDRGPDAFTTTFESEKRTLLAQAIGELAEREQQVLSLYYYDELTMKEVGTVLGVTESRVCQIHSAAVVRLRARMSELLGEPDLPAQPSGKGPGETPELPSSTKRRGGLLSVLGIRS